MDKQISGGEVALKGIFSKEYLYEIPPYQRPYAWTTEEVGTLFDDLYSFFKLEKDDIYFLGSIVLIKNHGQREAEVVDGQQRLTSLTILFSAIASLLKDEDGQREVREYIREAGKKVERIEPRPRLRLREMDRSYFEKYIQGNSLAELKDSVPKTEPQKRIKENCLKLVDKLNASFKTDDELLDFATFLATRCYLVVVTTPNQQSAFRVFSVMNSRGMPLLACDIIKADIIGKIKDATKREECTDKWEDLEDQIERSSFNDLFGYIRMIYARVKAQKGLLEEFRSSVLSVAENKDPIAFIDNTLEPLCDAYLDVKKCSYKSEADAGKINDYLKWLGAINNSDWMPPAILFFSKYRNDSMYILWFVKKLERLAAYLHITANDVNARISRYAEVIKEISETASSRSNPLKSIELTKAEQTEFLQVLDGGIYDRLTPPRRNYAILRLDSFLADASAKYDYTVLTIEHVLPQTVASGSEWDGWWGDKNMRKDWLNRVANLVPLARKHNSAAQNYNFETKKSVYFGGSSVTAYALTSQVNSYTEWTPDIVADRQEQLMKLYIDKWELAEGLLASGNGSAASSDSVRRTSFDGQLASASSTVQSIYKSFCDFMQTLGNDVTHDKRKFFTSFKKGKNSIVSVKLNRAEVLLFCKINFSDISQEVGFTRNMTGVGHVCNYDPSVELTVRNEADFEKAKVIILKTYIEN